MGSRAALVMWCAMAPGAVAQWNPAQAQWGKTDPRDVRVMTYNVRDGIRSQISKAEGSNAWCALARIVAAHKPDVLVLQETADNGGADSVATMQTVIGLFFNGGSDPFLGGTVGAWVQKYAPGYTLPHVHVGGITDNFNRNVILSRWPFADLNGDGRSQYDNFVNGGDLYAPGGGGGIRGFPYVEINLPDGLYRGNLVVGTCHLKSGGETQDLTERLNASKNIAYFIDYWYNGAGGSTPDPRGRIFDSPPPTMVLDAFTPVIWGGDFNEDENTNGRDGPAWWMTRAAGGANDGTDRDRSDAAFDDARDPLNSNNTTNRYTQGSSKLDYIAWQDSIATLRRAYVYQSSSGGPAAYPPELIGFPAPALASSTASDHRPVIADFILPAPPPPGAFSLLSPADGATGVSTTATLDWTDSAGATGYTVTIDDQPDFSSPLVSTGVTPSQYAIGPGVLSPGTAYFWRVVASNDAGTTPSTPASARFTTLAPAPGPFSLLSPSNGSVAVPTEPTLAWSVSAGASSYSVVLASDPGLTTVVYSAAGVAGTSLAVPPGVLAGCPTYYWSVSASNAGGTTAAGNAPFSFATLAPADFNSDGFVDFFDFDDYVLCFETETCPPGRTADTNGDGFIDFFDLDDFVALFEAGC